MRILLSVVVSLGLAFGMYLIFLHSVGKAVGGSPATATATVTVQVQLTNLAQAERIYFVQNNTYATIEQLSASGDFKLPNPDPNGYVYSVEVTDAGFTATAQHGGASGKSENYPVFTVDQTMSMRRGDAQADSAGQANGTSQADGAKPGDAAQPGNGSKTADSGAPNDAGKTDDIPSFPTSIPSLPAGLVPGNASGAAAQPQN